jgi:HAD superfamily hydrolase (TIGR01450 family)
MKEIIENKRDLNQWTEVMLDNLFIKSKLKAYPFDIGRSKWFEIDNFDDLSKAEILFNKHLIKVSKKKIFFLDGDGTLYLGDKEISGAKEFILKLKEKNRIVYLLTNNSSKTLKEHYERLKEIGIPIEMTEIYVSIQPALEFLKKEGINEIYWLANSKVSKFIEEQGFKFNEESPKAILLTYDTEINYNKITRLTYLIQSGVPYYATHSDIVCPTIKGVIPDLGSFIELIRLTTKKEPVKVFGKPNKEFIDSLLKKHNLNYSDSVIIGDRLYTDIKLKEGTEALAVLVLTGETKRDKYEKSKIKADIVLNKLSDLIEYI